MACGWRFFFLAMNERKGRKSVLYSMCNKCVSLICERLGREHKPQTGHRTIFTQSRFLHVPGKASDHSAAPVVAFVKS